MNSNVLTFEFEHLPAQAFIGFGLGQKAEAVAMEHHFDVHVLGANGIDVVLDVAHRAAVFFVVLTAIIVDVIHDFLFAIALVCVGIGCCKDKAGGGNCERHGH